MPVSVHISFFCVHSREDKEKCLGKKYIYIYIFLVLKVDPKEQIPQILKEIVLGGSSRSFLSS